MLVEMEHKIFPNGVKHSLIILFIVLVFFTVVRFSNSPRYGNRRLTPVSPDFSLNETWDEAPSTYPNTTMSGQSDHADIPLPKPFCLVGQLYGRSNNQILSISWARMLARRQNLFLLLTTSDGPNYLFIHWVNSFGNVSDIRWGGNDEVGTCVKAMSWHDAFQDMLRNKATISENEWPLITPLQSIQTQAALKWAESGLMYGSNITVHGRSFENSRQCQSTEHSGYPCDGEHLCDYRLGTVLNRFRQHLPTGVDPTQIVLFTDGQNQEYAREYPVVERDGNLFVHMWMMVLSPMHIGHPGSTVDYVIWRWRMTIQDKSTIHRFMLPWNCYNNQSAQE